MNLPSLSKNTLLKIACVTASAATTLLSGCVVAPTPIRARVIEPRVAVVAPAPVVVVRPYRGYYWRRW